MHTWIFYFYFNPPPSLSFPFNESKYSRWYTKNELILTFMLFKYRSVVNNFIFYICCFWLMIFFWIMTNINVWLYVHIGFEENDQYDPKTKYVTLKLFICVSGLLDAILVCLFPIWNNCKLKLLITYSWKIGLCNESHHIN